MTEEYRKPSPQEHIFFLVMRRMRAPLIVMVCITAISMLGMVLVPGVDEHGRPYHMSFFEAFYFVSFMMTTIGFGEIPHAFTPEQRFWVALCIYPTVVGWLYAFGSILTLMQDEVFRQRVFHAAFARHVRNLREPFFLVCGYGVTGHLLVSRLTDEYRQCVVMDIDQRCINELTVEDLHLYVPGLSADASESEHLVKAGLRHPMCRAVAAITNDDRANLKIAMTTRLLHPGIPVVARTESSDAAVNMRAFGVHHVINPYELFVEELAEAMKHPNHYRFRTLLMDGGEDGRAAKLAFLADRPWLLYGEGRLGRMIHQRLTEEGIRLAMVDGHGSPGAVGKEALRAAGAERAAGIIAVGDDDMDNLSVIMAARSLQPEIFSIARQVAVANGALFDAMDIDMRMQDNYLVARQTYTWLSTPLLHDFADQIARISERHVNRLMQRIAAKVSVAETFETWQVRLDNREAPAVVEAIRGGLFPRLGDLLRDPWHPDRILPQIALLVEGDGREWILPGPSLELNEGMNLLFCGRRTTAWRAVLCQSEALAYATAHRARSKECESA